MKRKKIILIRNAQPYDFGGAERFPVFVGKILKEEYGNPVIISSSPSLLKYAKEMNLDTIQGPWWKKQNLSGARLVLLPLYLLWQIFLFFWYLIIFIHQRPKAVHIQSKDDFIAATFAGRLVGATVIWTDHADLKHIWRNITVWYKNPVGKMVYVASWFTHAITLISKSEYKEVTSQLPKRSRTLKRLIIVHNGCPDVKDNYSNKVRSGNFTFASTNRLVREKGIKEMIEAFRKFHKKFPESRLVLVGSGPKEKHFKKLALKDPAIIFTGFQSDPLSFVANSDVLLQPTYHEGFSISILEGFMLQKPVIATAVGGNVEMITNNQNGLLIPSRDSEALYKAMVELYKDPKKRKEFAKRGRSLYLDRFVFNEIVKNSFIPIYERSFYK